VQELLGAHCSQYIAHHQQQNPYPSAAAAAAAAIITAAAASGVCSTAAEITHLSHQLSFCRSSPAWIIIPTITTLLTASGI